MQAILGGQAATWVIPLESEGGVQLSATGIQYRVTKQDGTELLAKTPLVGYVAGDVTATVTVSALVNTLANATAGRELRMIELFVTTADGIVKVEYSYVIEAEALLAVGVNSFQSYGSALMTAYELPNVEGWNQAVKLNRVNALIAAWRNIGKLHLQDSVVTAMNRLGASQLMPNENVTAMTADEYSTLSLEMRNALSRAQILEADFLLGGDEVGDIRRSGIMSATVGESSQFFRPAKPLEAAVCKRAMRELSAYILSPRRALARN